MVALRMHELVLTSNDVSPKRRICVNSLSANSTKCSNTLKYIVDKLPTNCLSVFDHFVKSALKGLSSNSIVQQLTVNILNNGQEDKSFVFK